MLLNSPLVNFRYFISFVGKHLFQNLDAYLYLDCQVQPLRHKDHSHCLLYFTNILYILLLDQDTENDGFESAVLPQEGVPVCSHPSVN